MLEQSAKLIAAKLTNWLNLLSNYPSKFSRLYGILVAPSGRPHNACQARGIQELQCFLVIVSNKYNFCCVALKMNSH